VLHVCDYIACMCAGSQELCDALEAAHGPAGTPGADGRATWLRSPCLGLCDRAPATLLLAAGEHPVERQFAPVSATDATAMLATGAPDDSAAVLPTIGGMELRLLHRVGKVDPSSLDDYRRHGGYEALREAFVLGPDRVVAEVTAANLLGRGGAAFPAGRKLDAVAHAPARPHYAICNADESEPGTFKDRILMESDPFAVVESLTIAALAASAERGFIYVRGEYPLAAQRLQHAIDEARAHGFLGDDVMGRGFCFDIEIRRGAGAYICGEETALFNSIEGKRGEPRSKPPFPAQAGVFGKPTLVNNVETLVNLPQIVLDGGAAFAAIGTAGSTGTRLFCLSGTIVRPGLYEVPHGATIRELIEMAGGLQPKRTLRAILLGGAAGAFVGPESLDMPLTFEDARAGGVTLGSGVIMVFDETIDLMPILLRIAAFFRDESCGQCVPCRIGTVRQEEVLERLMHGHGDGRAQDVALLNDIGRVMRDASICGLGQAAMSAIESAQRTLKVLESGSVA